MGSARNAEIQLEQGQTLVSWEALTDSGDRTVFNPSAAVISRAVGKEPVVRPNGIVTGVNLVTPNAGVNDSVSVAAFTAYEGGTEHSVSAGTVAITRPAVDTHKVCSITMTTAGALAEVEGSEGTSFSETRGAAGGPPLIPVDSIEIAQVRVSSQTAAVITTAEIYQVPGQHTERYDFPSFELNTIGEGVAASVSARQTAFVVFASALPAIHTGSVPKEVYAQYYTPVFAALSKAHSFVPVEKSHSVSSQAYYGGSSASTSETIGQGSFTVLLTDGITDALVARKNDNLVVKFKSDRNRTPYVLTQGLLGISRTFPAEDDMAATVTISAEAISAEFAG